MIDEIKEAYNRCKEYEALEPDDNRYVPLSELGVRGSDRTCLEFLRTTVLMADVYTHQLFSGFKGSGKTTELKLLAKSLEANGYEVVYIDSEKYLNLREPTSVTDLLITTAAGIDAFLGRKTFTDPAVPFERFWPRLKAFLGTDISVKGVTLSIPDVGELEAAFTGNPDFKTTLSQALMDRLPALARQCQAYLDEALAQIAKRKKHSAGTVLIVDSFEKLRGEGHNAEAIRRSLESVFIRDWKYLELPCHVIYTVPPWMIFMEFVTAGPADRVQVLPMCKVWDPKKDQADEKGIAAMSQILEKRMDLAALFEHPADLREIVSASGGYPRDLLRMVREVLQRAWIAKAPLPIASDKTKEFIDRVIELGIESAEMPIADENLDLLIRIGKNRSIGGHTKDELDRLADLFDNHFILSYRNGKMWFDLHPLVRKSEKMKRALRDEKTADPS
jgi:hypothetical protein